MRSILVAIALIIGISACKKSTPAPNQAELDDQTIKSYISSHQLNATATGSGLYYVIETQGTGPQATASSIVNVKYKGYLTNGTVFDQSAGYETDLNSVIQGWKEGIPHFKKGGVGKLLIPSALGYGSQATGNIPANSVLIFDITLQGVR